MIAKAEISLVRSLADKKAREEHGLFVVEGPKMVREAVDSGFTLERIYGLEEFAEFSKRDDFSQASGKDLERMSGLRAPQGVLALVRIPRCAIPPLERGKLTLALDGIQDPGNLGTILRIADWFGVERIVCSDDTADRFNPKVVQASMGAIFRVAVEYAPDLARTLSALGNNGYNIYGAFLEGEDIYTADLGHDPAGIIVMGNEGKGISQAVAQTITHKLHIPPYPPAEPTSESLNVAAATAVICSEFRRPRR